MNGLSLQDLSDLIGNRFNKQILQRLETGEAKPDSETISLLSKALKLPPDYFFRETTVNLKELSFRKLKKLSAKEQEKVVAQTIDYLERYIELENLLSIDNKISFLPKGYVVKDENDVADAAITLHKKWKLGEDPLPNILEMLEENQIKVFQTKADKSFSGMSTILNKQIAVIVLNHNEEIPLVRRRFTALHELAHLYLNLSPFDEKRAEKLCDHFAACMLLLPFKLKEILGENRGNILMKELYFIAEQYGISLSAIAYHAFRTGIISASYHKFFMIQYNRYKTRGKEFHVYSGKEKTERFLQLLFRAVAEEIISTSKGAALNNQKLADFRELLDTSV